MKFDDPPEGRAQVSSAGSIIKVNTFGLQIRADRKRGSLTKPYSWDAGE